MLSVKEARQRARKKAERHMRSWAAFGEDEASLAISLGPPTERQAMSDLAAATRWVAEWRGIDGVEWVERSWPSAGTQSVPHRLVLSGAAAISGFGARTLHRRWQVLSSRCDGLRGSFPTALKRDAVGAATLKTHGNDLADLSVEDFDRLLQVLAWLVEHPGSGRRVRQLPIRGIDTKWIESHRSLVDDLHLAVTGRADLGLAEQATRIRVRFLDPELAPGGLRDVQAAATELALLKRLPERVFVFENLETVLAMPDVPRAVAVHGAGYGAGDRLRSLAWMADCAVVYWGDLDSHGFGILNEFRTHFPHATSALMDIPTLRAHSDLWGSEPKPATGEFARLTADESSTLEQLRRDGDIRLEQERIDWGYALEHLPGVPSPPRRSACEYLFRVRKYS